MKAMSSKPSPVFLAPPVSHGFRTVHPRQIDTAVLSFNPHGRLGENDRGHFKHQVSRILDCLNLGILSIQDGKFTIDPKAYVKLEFKEVGYNTLAYVGFSGRFWNLGREVEGLDCLGVFQRFYAELSTSQPLSHAFPDYKVAIKQFDICQDHVGQSVIELGENYYQVKGARKNKAVHPSSLNPGSVVALPVSRKDLEDPETLYLNLKTENNRQGKPKKYLVSVKLYDKYKKFSEFYPASDPYWIWYRLKAKASKLLTRIEVSIKTTRECGFVTQAFEEAMESGELLDEQGLIAKVLHHVYNGHKASNRKKDLRPRLNNGKTLEPVLKSFFTMEKPDTLLRDKPRNRTLGRVMDAKEKLKRQLKEVCQAHLHSFSLEEMNQLASEIFNPTINKEVIQ